MDNQTYVAAVEAANKYTDITSSTGVAVHEPIVQNGTWWTYNASTGEYQDTGANAEGPIGPQGLPGAPGKDGQDG